VYNISAERRQFVATVGAAREALQRYQAWSRVNGGNVSRLLVSIKDACGAADLAASIHGEARRCAGLVEQARAGCGGQGRLGLEELLRRLDELAQGLGLQCHTDADSTPGVVLVFLTEERFYVEIVIQPASSSGEGPAHVQTVRVAHTDDVAAAQQPPVWINRLSLRDDATQWPCM
jgi:hypothetical protein